MAIKLRHGLDRMRTHINRRMSANQQPHELYMKLTSLEIERSRRDTERDAVEKRLEIIDSRIRDIQAEQELVQAKLTQIREEKANPQVAPRKVTDGGNLQY